MDRCGTCYHPQTPQPPHGGGVYPGATTHMQTSILPPNQTRGVPHTVEYVPMGCPPQYSQDVCEAPPQHNYDPCDTCDPCDPCACDCEDDDTAPSFEEENTRVINSLRAKLGLPVGGSSRGAEWDKASPANAARIKELRGRLGIPCISGDGGAAARLGSDIGRPKFRLPEIDFSVMDVLNEPMPPSEGIATGRAYGDAPALGGQPAMGGYVPPPAAGYSAAQPVGPMYAPPAYSAVSPAPAPAPGYSNGVAGGYRPSGGVPNDYSTYAPNRNLTEWERWDHREVMNPHIPSPEELGAQTAAGRQARGW